MERKPFITSSRIVLALIGLAVLYLAYGIWVRPSARDIVWRHEFLSALDNATEVHLVEHSNLEEQFRVGHPPKIYAKVDLNPMQIAQLRDLFSEISDETPTWGILKCKFEEHHYIEMVAKDGSTRTALLCFECGQYYLDNKPDDLWTYSELGKMSESWKGRMSDFITSLGLHPDGPWWGPDGVGQSANASQKTIGRKRHEVIDRRYSWGTAAITERPGVASGPPTG